MDKPNICRQCFKPACKGWVTCGNSHCQEQESKDNAMRAKGAKARRRDRR
jgi:hypothetical protein